MKSALRVLYYIIINTFELLTDSLSFLLDKVLTDLFLSKVTPIGQIVQLDSV